MTTLTTLSVDGMTCKHCVSAVTRELDVVEGVGRVSVELRKGETSAVTVYSAAPLDEALLREAIDEAGYDVVGVDVVKEALAATMTARAPQYSGRTDEGAAVALADAPADAPADGPATLADARAEEPATSAAPAPDGHGHAHAGGGGGGCCGGNCGCGGKGRQGLGIGLPIVPKD